MRDLTYAELFAGAGGMSIGLEAAGWRCVAHAEIEPHARAVLRKRWPSVPLYGDVCTIHGSKLPNVDAVTFGAPCQDLSIAGKRAGMAKGSGTRSELFFEAIRIWRESNAPLALYENVLGAYSSNDGRDFAAVLSAFVGAAVPVPADGWRNAGVASGPAGIAAWRTLDAQHFGWNGNTTPQRRRRVFVLGARAGVCDPAEVLLVADGLLGHLAPSREAGEGVTADTGRSVAEPGRFLTYDARGNGDGQVVNTLAGDHQNRVTDYTAVVLGTTVSGVDKQKGIPTHNDQVVFPTITMGAHPAAPGLNGQDAPQMADAIMRASGVGIPRRLMPVECERLMGWPDQWTAQGIDEKGREYALSDTARFRLVGNGIASPVTAWIGLRLREVLDSQRAG